LGTKVSRAGPSTPGTGGADVPPPESQATARSTDFHRHDGAEGAKETPEAV